MPGAENVSCGLRGLVGRDGLDRLRIGVVIALGVGRRARAFAQHVEGIAIACCPSPRPPLQRFLDRPSTDELAGQDAHGIKHGLADDGLAAFRDKPAQDILRLVVETDDAAGEQKAEGRGVDEKRVRLAEMGFPIANAQLVLDQTVAGLGVGNAQQRLGEAEQHHAFLARQPVLLQKSVEPAPARGLPALLAHRQHELAREACVAFASSGESRAFSISASASVVSSARCAAEISARDNSVVSLAGVGGNGRCGHAG